MLIKPLPEVRERDIKIIITESREHLNQKDSFNLLHKMKLFHEHVQI
jgi:hypothetical protein